MVHDRKKSFFELNQSPSRSNKQKDKSPVSKLSDRISKSQKEEGELDTTLEKTLNVAAPEADISKADAGKSSSIPNEIDLNALDYEADRDDNNEELLINKKSESMALAFGVEIKSDEKAPAGGSFKKGDRLTTRRRGDENKTVEKRGGDRRNSRDRSRNRSRERSRGRRVKSRDRSDNRPAKRGRERTRTPEKPRRDRQRGSRDQSERYSR